MSVFDITDFTLVISDKNIFLAHSSLGQFKIEASVKDINLDIEFDYLHYEPFLNNYYYIKNDEKYQLNEASKNNIKSFIDSVVSNLEYSVYAYDPARHNVYVGKMSSAEISSSTYKGVLLEPEFIISKYNETEKKWDEIKAIIRSDGSLILDPDSVCDSCVLLLNEKEWEAFPKFDDKNRFAEWKYDFVENIWKDSRTFSSMYEVVNSLISSIIDGSPTDYKGRSVSQNEMIRWYIQFEEAKLYKLDASNKTPFLDAFIAGRTDVIKKEDLVDDIIRNHTEYAIESGKTHAKLWNILKKLKKCTTIKELDDLYYEILDSHTTQ